MRRTLTHFAAGALALALGAAPARADVIVVDAGGGGDFLSVHEAVAAAADGDVVLVRPGDYTNPPENPIVAVDGGRSLSIVADGGPVLTPPIQVSDLPAGKTVVLRGLDARLNQIPLFGGSTLEVRDCDGQVWAEDCIFVGYQGSGGFGAEFPGWPGVFLQDAEDVVLSRCAMTGGDGVDVGLHFFRISDGGPGLDAVGSDVQLYDCTLVGGRGGDDDFQQSSNPGYDGGAGARLSGSTALIAGSTLQGGDGGDGQLGHVEVKYTGGHGLHLTGNFSQARLLDATLVPGAGGFDSGGLQGPSGNPTQVEAGYMGTWPGAARQLSLSSPFRENELATLTYKGEQGDVIHLFGGFSTLSVPLYGHAGHWMIDVPWIEVLALATVTDPDGEYELSFFIAPFPNPAHEELEMWAQLFVQTSGGAVRVSSPASMTMIDESF